MKGTESCLAVAVIVILIVGTAHSSRNNRHENDAATCQLASEIGNCKASMTRWFFNKDSGECSTFIYGGCGGNANRFRSKAQCESRCQAASGTRCPPQQCRRACEHGFVVNSRGCRTCACNPAPDTAACPQIECPDRCSTGYQQDEHGCMTCECKTTPSLRMERSQDQQCPSNNCLMECQYGHKQDEQGCDICSCYTKEEVCGPQCRMSCQTGFVTDARGCELCECKPAAPPTVKCVANRCHKRCAHGFQKDSFGCNLCICATRKAPIDCSRRGSCRMYCPYRFVTDSDGCETCKCASANPGHHLGKVGQRRRWNNRGNSGEVCGATCTKYCPEGYEKDRRGCNTCTCKGDGSIRPVQLPAGLGHQAVEHPSQLPAGIPSQLPAEHETSAQLPEYNIDCVPMRGCRRECPYGFLKDSFGCNVCICNHKNRGAPNRCDNRPACAMSCELGFKKGPDGCDTCSCNDPPVSAVDCSTKPMISCRMFCENGFKKGSDGCDTCSCNDSLATSAVDCGTKPMVSCRMFCEHGFQKGSDGCDTCSCNSSPAPPPAPALAVVSSSSNVACGLRAMCAMQCEFGFQKGSDGCDVCQCNDAPAASIYCGNRPMCRKYCENGFRKGSDGCDICVCA